MYLFKFFNSFLKSETNFVEFHRFLGGILLNSLFPDLFEADISLIPPSHLPHALHLVLTWRLKGIIGPIWNRSETAGITLPHGWFHCWVIEAVLALFYLSHGGCLSIVIWLPICVLCHPRSIDCLQVYVPSFVVHELIVRHVHHHVGQLRVPLSIRISLCRPHLRHHLKRVSCWFTDCLKGSVWRLCNEHRWLIIVDTAVRSEFSFLFIGYHWRVSFDEGFGAGALTYTFLFLREVRSLVG